MSGSSPCMLLAAVRILHPQHSLDGAGGIHWVEPLRFSVLLGLRVPIHTDQVVGCY